MQQLPTNLEHDAGTPTEATRAADAARPPEPGVMASTAPETLDRLGPRGSGSVARPLEECFFDELVSTSYSIEPHLPCPHTWAQCSPHHPVQCTSGSLVSNYLSQGGLLPTPSLHREHHTPESGPRLTTGSPHTHVWTICAFQLDSSVMAQSGYAVPERTAKAARPSRLVQTLRTASRGQSTTWLAAVATLYTPRLCLAIAMAGFDRLLSASDSTAQC